MVSDVILIKNYSCDMDSDGIIYFLPIILSEEQLEIILLIRELYY